MCLLAVKEAMAHNELRDTTSCRTQRADGALQADTMSGREGASRRANRNNLPNARSRNRSMFVQRIKSLRDFPLFARWSGAKLVLLIGHIRAICIGPIRWNPVTGFDFEAAATARLLSRRVSKLSNWKFKSTQNFQSTRNFQAREGRREKASEWFDHSVELERHLAGNRKAHE